ncbi:hypothetical protein LTS18_000638, partial [Coniosporium uncinatum]
FLDSDLSTALILEDDVDWDIHLRTTQIPLVAHAFRTLTHASHPPHSRFLPRSLKTPDPDPSTPFWGPTPNWEILYLGHCGDFFPITALHPDPTSSNPTSLLSSDHSDRNLPPQTLPGKAWEASYIPAPAALTESKLRLLQRPLPHSTFTDPTLLPPEKLHAQTRTFLQNLSLPPQRRILHASKFPLCTFGYGVTRASAARIVEEFGKEAEGGTHA